MDIEYVRSRFIKHFDGTTGAVYASPGRINLIGEHTDYNGGFVFPGAIDKGMIAEIKPNGTNTVKAYSIDLKDYVEFGLNEEDAPRASWARYIFGVCREMMKRGVDVKGFNTAFAGDVPLGAGMSSSAYNKRRQSCEAAVAAVQKKHPHVEFLRDVTMGMLEEAKADISAEDYMRAEYVIEEIQRVLDVCDALEKGDYETVGQKMYETHHGMSKLYEVSCEELDFLNDLAFDCGVTGSRVMGGGFGGCTINLVKDELYSTFIEKAKDEFKKKFGRSPKVYDVVISDGARRLE